MRRWAIPVRFLALGSVFLLGIGLAGWWILQAAAMAQEPEWQGTGPSQVAAATLFTDVTVEMNASAPGYGVGTAWGDYDRDGDLDLYVVNLGYGGGGEANILLRNDGDTFVDATAEAGVGDSGPGVAAAWADIDNDGDLDLFVSNRPGSNALYLNEGDGHFQDVAVAAGVSDPGGYGEGAAWADDDRDGLVDLYVANYTGAPGNQPNRLFHNLDGYHFQDVADVRQVAHFGNGEGIAWADFDNDGDLDLYVANASGINALFQRQGDGTFQDVTQQMHVPGGPGSSFGVSWGDYDNDGWLDLYVAQQGSNILYRNDGGTDFVDVTLEAGVGGDRWSLGSAWGDFDNDGDLDLHVANADISGYDPGDVLYRNEGGVPVTFGDVTAMAGVTNTLDARGSAWGDYDGDGDLDLYVVNQGTTGEPNHLFRNDSDGNGWLKVVPLGRVSNRAGIGARVVVTGQADQIREISGGSGFASQDSLEAEFGLGDWGGPVDVTVHWPSGIQSALSEVATGRTITVTEPAPELSGAAKAASTGAALPNQVLTYTLSVPNDGDWTAPASVTDTLPSGLRWGGFLTATAGTPIWDAVGRRVLWLGAISEGMAVTITYRVAVQAQLEPGVVLTNAATVDDGYRPPFDTPPVTVTVLCRELAAVAFVFAPSEPVVGQGVQFTATATGSLPITFTWEFGDGGEADGQAVSHPYTVADDYLVVLTAGNVCSQETVTQTVSVEPLPWRVYLPVIVRSVP